MLAVELKNKLNISDEEFNKLINLYGLQRLNEIDNLLAQKILKRYSIQKAYENLSNLKGIVIEGLFGKYDYNLEFNNMVNIYVAENGHGKTTIIKILVAVLNRDIEALRNMPFNKVILKFKENDDVIIQKPSTILKRNGFKFEEKNLCDLEYLASRKNAPKAIKILTGKIGQSLIPIDEVRMILEVLKENDIISSLELKESNRFLNKNTNKFYLSFEDISNNVKELVKYLPTFRRVEADLKELYSEESEVEKYLQDSRLRFGLKDVESILQNLRTKLTTEAFETHAVINGQILGDLVSKSSLKITEEQRQAITLEKVQIILGRIGKDKVAGAENLTSFIKEGKINYQGNNKEFVEYYLYKLIRIYESQSEVDNKIKKYRDICNSYLINKELQYDEISARIYIVDKEDTSEIKFSELSSGEKQILSIFSELYLEDNPNMIYLIDEPELSLSIAWQKKILKDIINSGKVSLLIATTHSPFIFKNELEVFAKDLNKFKIKTLSKEIK